MRQERAYRAVRQYDDLRNPPHGDHPFAMGAFLEAGWENVRVWDTTGFPQRLEERAIANSDIFFLEAKLCQIAVYKKIIKNINN